MRHNGQILEPPHAATSVVWRLIVEPELMAQDERFPQAACKRRFPAHEVAGLLPHNLIFFAPVECDLSQGSRAECEPSWFDTVPANSVLEIPECSGAVDNAQKIFANTVGLYRAREILHDRPLVNLKLRGKLPEPFRGNDTLSELPFLCLPFREI